MDEKTLIKVGVKLVGLIVMILGTIGLIQFLVQSLVTASGVGIPADYILPSVFELAIGWYLAKHTEPFTLWFWGD